MKNILKFSSHRWTFLLVSYLAGLTVFTFLMVSSLVIKFTEVRPGEAVPLLEFTWFALLRVATGPILLVAHFGVDFTSIPFLILPFAMILAYPLNPRKRNAVITILGLFFWFIMGSSLVATAIT